MLISMVQEGGRIYLTTPYEMKHICKALPGSRWHKDRKRWSVPATPAAARAVLEALSRYDSQIDDETLELAAQTANAAQARRLLNAKEFPPIPKTKTKPWKHQLQAFWFMAEIFGDRFDAS